MCSPGIKSILGYIIQHIVGNDFRGIYDIGNVDSNCFPLKTMKHFWHELHLLYRNTVNKNKFGPDNNKKNYFIVSYPQIFVTISSITALSLSQQGTSILWIG